MKIKNKIFILTIAIYGVIIFGEFIFGKYFLEDIYELLKKRELNKIAARMDTLPKTNKLLKLQEDSGAKFIVFDNNESYLEEFNYLKLEANGRSYNIILDNIVDDFKEMIYFERGREVEVELIKLYEDTYIPLRLDDYRDYEIGNFDLGYEKVEVEGIVTEVQILDREDDELVEFLTLYTQKNQGFDSWNEFIREEDGDRYHLITKVFEGRVLVIFYNYTSIQEAIDIFGRLLLYTFVFAMILAFFASLFFSRLLTRVIVDINNKVRNMTTLDFKEELDTKSKDEIGELSKNINFLSNTLEQELKRKEQEKNNTRELLANLSHEFKTPLTLISGYVEVLKMDGDNEYLDIIEKESERLNKLIEQTLYAMRLEGAVASLDKKLIRLDLLVEEVLKSFEKKYVELEFITKFEVAEVEADQLKIEQVVYNLVSNGIKHAENKLKVEVIHEGEYIACRVANDGRSLEDKELDKVWKKFYKGENEGRSGTGLGLYISANIIDLHHGFYGIRQDEEFVEFYFKLEKNKNI